MRGILQCLIVGFCLLCLPGHVFAKDDPDYNPAQNFHPQNVTGLTGMYAWVGSYYNATTRVDLIVERGYNGTVLPCAPLLNYSTSMQWDSILAILDRGVYNNGSNSVNLLYALMPPDFNKSMLNWEPYQIPFLPLWWVSRSSIPTWQDKENTTVNDLFSLTTTKSSESFSLTGMEHTTGLLEEISAGYKPISMPTCNSSYYDGHYDLELFTLSRDSFWSTQGWTDFKLPTVNVSFDGETANFTFDGKFVAYPYLRMNDTGYEGSAADVEKSVDDSVQGAIRFTFTGVLDAYHSDVLNMNGTTPTWLRTVGFGNNSLNVGYGSGSSGRPRIGGGVVLMALCLFVALV